MHRRENNDSARSTDVIPPHLSGNKALHYIIVQRKIASYGTSTSVDRRCGLRDAFASSDELCYEMATLLRCCNWLQLQQCVIDSTDTRSGQTRYQLALFHPSTAVQPPRKCCGRRVTINRGEGAGPEDRTSRQIGQCSWQGKRASRSLHTYQYLVVTRRLVEEEVVRQVDRTSATSLSETVREQGNRCLVIPPPHSTSTTGR